MLTCVQNSEIGHFYFADDNKKVIITNNNSSRNITQPIIE